MHLRYDHFAFAVLAGLLVVPSEFFWLEHFAAESAFGQKDRFGLESF